MDINDLADFHVAYSQIKSRDHHSCCADEFKRFASVIGRIELFSVIVSALVVDFYSLSCVFGLEEILRHSASRASAAAAGIF